MRVIGLDGALARASAALLQDGVVVAEARRDGARGQPAALPALAAEVLAASPGPADAVAVVVGPGGFTGLRAAIALAQGLAAGWGVPCLGVTTGEALAAALPEWQAAGRAVWSATTAGRGRVVLERPGEEPGLFDEPGLPAPGGPVVTVGDAAPVVAARLLARGADVLLSDARLPEARDAAALVALALAEGRPGRPAAPVYAEPVYVRTSHGA
ncbi:tRNA (adenosine(37)-N6)-threonylcarbamoyltransferase complex dimerization subunit type 1 TsaB [Muricoccus radiodurans]|uniref:tRNA (adenosine(37)-N6)-threonylcarbamoyltransferase complex dimerization subunit type 1 TsaB n=1 Tax=Muricoccus radiodurans TaxID=2231721 RepID=UPI003CEDBF33